MHKLRDDHGRRPTKSVLSASVAIGAGLAMVCSSGPAVAATRPQHKARVAKSRMPSSVAAPTPTAAAGSDACGTLIPKASGGYWQCSLDATFTGNSLDTSVWAPLTTATSGFHSGPECLVDSPNNISVGNGVLTLTVRKEAQPFICSSPLGSFATQYTGATVSTYGLFSQAYGRFEVRAKVPSTFTPGLQESFWMWPVNDTLYGTWPYSGEIDIAEIYSEYADRAIPFIHYNNYFDTNVTNDYCMINIGNWNTYDLVWTPTTLQISFNGTTCVVDNWNPLPPQVKPEPFNQPFIIALSAVLGVAPNAFVPGVTPLPATTEVQWVKAWK